MKHAGVLLAIAIQFAVVPWARASAGEDELPAPVRPTEGIDVGGGSETVTDALQGKDGVRIQTMCTHCNSANIQVGGLSQDLVPMFRDGYPLLGGLATSFVLSVLPADTVAEAAVVKGPAGAREPASAAGGSIELTESRPAEVPWVDLTAEAGSYDLRSGLVRLAGPLASWLSAAAVAGTQRADPVDDDADGWNDVGAVDRQFAEGRMVFEAGRDHVLDVGASWIEEDTLDGRGAYDALTYQGPGSEPAWTREDTLLERREYRAGWQWRLDSGGELHLQMLQATRDQSVRSQQTRDTASPFSEFFERFKIQDRGRWGALRFEQPVGVGWMVRGGIETAEQRVEAATIPDPAVTTPDQVVDYVKSWSGFTDVEWTPAPQWNVRFGVRYADLRWGGIDLGRQVQQRQWLPRATLRFSPRPAWKLKLILGKTTRAPKPIFSEVCCGQQYERSINARREVGTTAGLETLFQPSPTLRLSMYAARTVFDEHLLRMVGSSFFYIQTYTLANIPRARADTAEISAQWSPAAWVTLDASAGWLSFHNTGDENVTVNVTPLFFTMPQPVELPVRRIPYQPVRTGSISAELELPRRVLVNLQANYTGPMMIQQFADDPLALPAPPDIPSILRDEMRETPGFWLSNLSVRIPLASGFELVGAVNNLSDRIQNDLGDPTTDYNWGPLAGRSWRLGLRYHLDR